MNTNMNTNMKAVQALSGQQRILTLFVTVLLLAMAHAYVHGVNDGNDVIELEAAPGDISISPRGETYRITHIDASVAGEQHVFALFTEAFGARVLVDRERVAVRVNDRGQVLDVLNASALGEEPSWESARYVTVPADGYVVVAYDAEWKPGNPRHFLATQFAPGDVVKLRRNGEIIRVQAVMTSPGPQATIMLTTPAFITVTTPYINISGNVSNRRSHHQLVANGEPVAMAADGAFTYEYVLSPGTNYIDMTVMSNGTVQDQRSLTVFYKQHEAEVAKDVYLWVEQGPNVNRFPTPEAVYKTLAAAKEAGFTAVILDTKGVEGYAAYKQNDLTGRPYMSEMRAPTRRGANPDMDLLAEFVRHGHALGLKVFSSFNVFAEGSFAHNESAVLRQHPHWEEVVYRYEDGGRLLPLSLSRYRQNGALVQFINPAHPQARAYQLHTIEEVLKNYDIDGVIVDRGRYDNFFADFSDLSRQQFEAYLARKNVTLTTWPDDVFTYSGSARIDGPLIHHWYAYRASVIRDFFVDLRQLVDGYNATKAVPVTLGAYVGSWYDTYYLHGANWASPRFVYDQRLNLPQSGVYTDAYAATAYADNLDLLIIGTYQSTAAEVRHFITLGSVVTDGQVPLAAGMYLPNIKEAAVQREVFQAGLQLTDGLMIFDLSQANFPLIKAGLLDEEFVQPYQLGVSHPRQPDEFIQISYLNANRNENDINLYTTDFGASTNTSTWGVEMVVDREGIVRVAVNKTQAMFWQWSGVQLNNSVIPPGGFVISAEDPSGQRNNRQLIANAYRVGDEVRAAALTVLLPLAGARTALADIQVEAEVTVIGPGRHVAVVMNGAEAAPTDGGRFVASLPLAMGANEIVVEVTVDGLLTNRQTVRIEREETVTLDDVRRHLQNSCPDCLLPL